MHNFRSNGGNAQNDSTEKKLEMTEYAYYALCFMSFKLFHLIIYSVRPNKMQRFQTFIISFIGSN